MLEALAPHLPDEHRWGLSKLSWPVLMTGFAQGQSSFGEAQRESIPDRFSESQLAVRLAESSPKSGNMRGNQSLAQFAGLHVQCKLSSCDVN